MEAVVLIGFLLIGALVILMVMIKGATGHGSKSAVKRELREFTRKRGGEIEIDTPHATFEIHYELDGMPVHIQILRPGLFREGPSIDYHLELPRESNDRPPRTWIYSRDHAPPDSKGLDTVSVGDRTFDATFHTVSEDPKRVLVLLDEEARQEMLGLWSLVAPRYLTISVRGMGFRIFKWIPILSSSPLVIIEKTAKVMVARLFAAAKEDDAPDSTAENESSKSPNSLGEEAS